jgi:hypothetical protein
LTAQEFEIIKAHPKLGARVLEKAVHSLEFQSYFEIGYQIVLSHHENWDGSGYPQGLTGKDIPLSARIMSIADVYDALTTSRPYKRAFSHEKALQIISTKVEPYAQVIDVATDRVVITVGSDHTTETIGGNDGGNATGHSGWLDPNHFYLMDRYRNSIFVYKINEDYPPYTVTLTDTFITNTSAHSLNPAEPRHLLSTNVFYIAVEGSVASKDNVVPRVIKVTFDRISGTLHEEAFLEFPGATVDSRLHHFGINPSGTLMGVPLSDVNNTGNDVAYVVDLDTFTITNQYDVGLGAGHCDFSDSRNILCVTNHYDNFVSLIDMNNDTVTNINISSETPSWGSYIQSHRNWVTKDGNFFYMFETKIGTFLEFELLNLTLNRSTVTGGTPIQSTS